MKSFLSCSIVLLMVLMTLGIGSAAIVQWDEGIDGFYDEDTELYWIDPIYFVNMKSVDHWFTYNPGWELATSEQLSTLYDNAMSTDYWSFINAIGQPTLELDYGGGSWYRYWEGYMLEDELNNDAFRVYHIYEPDLIGGVAYDAYSFDSSSSDFYGEPGAWVVSTAPIPEPATLFLLGSGLVGLAGFGRKKFKK